MVTRIHVQTTRRGLMEISREIQDVVSESGTNDGLCTILIQHTSASLTIQENADPSARRDLEEWMNRHVPENQPEFTHTLEGPDDMPSHIRAAITSTSLSIPVMNGRLALGTWQGIYVWEHRRSPHRRSIAIHVSK